MDSNSELEKIIEKIAKSLTQKKSGKIRKAEYKTKIVGPESPHGIYVYDKSSNEWVLVRKDGDAFEPWKDGYYVIYFDNTMCPACRIYDLSWYVFVETIGKRLENTEFVIILCRWFSRDCESEAASKSFKKYGVIASPTTLLLKRENGKIVKEEKIRGVKKLDELIKIVTEFTGS